MSAVFYALAHATDPTPSPVPSMMEPVPSVAAPGAVPSVGVAEPWPFVTDWLQLGVNGVLALLTLATVVIRPYLPTITSKATPRNSRSSIGSPVTDAPCGA